MKTIVAKFTGDRGFYDVGRVEDMTEKQKKRFDKSYSKYVSEYNKRAANGKMFEQMKTKNQYLNEYKQLRELYANQGKDPGKRHLPEQIAKSQQYERIYKADLNLFRDFKEAGFIENDVRFTEFRSMNSLQYKEIFDNYEGAMKNLLISLNNELKVSHPEMSGKERSGYISQYYYGSP